METATAAAGSALRKLQAYLSNHDDGHRGDVEKLGQELGSIHAALLLRAQAPPPPGQLRNEEPAGAWAGEARELAYDVEDAVDGLLVTPPPPPGSLLSHQFKGLLQRAADLSRTCAQTPNVPTAPAAADRPREEPLPPDGEAAVVGVDEARDRLIRRLRLRDNSDEAGDGDDPVQVVSVVGSPGLGKTALAGAAFGARKPRFDCAAFVSVGLDPDVPRVLESAFRQLGVGKEADAGERSDEDQLIGQLRGFLQNKSQENFVAILDGEQGALPSDVPVRRVSVRGGSKAEDSASLGSMSVPQLRALSVFSPATAETIDLNRFGFLRVLDLEGCDLSESHFLQKHLGGLIQLRYLGLRETRIVSVPEEIGKLKFLQTLDLDDNLRMNEVPASVTQLRELTCLRVYWQTRLPTGVGKLTALEELSDATTRDSPELVKELRCLTKLRTLRITLWKPSRCEEEALVESLRRLRELRTLDVYVAGGDGKEKLDAVREAWAPPPCLREFRARSMNTAWSPLRHLPSWLLAADAAAAAPRLAVLVVQVAELRQCDVDALGRLPSLRVLRLEPDATAESLHVAGGAFPSLTELRLRDADVAPAFRPGAMPRLRRLEVCIRVRRTVDLGNGGFEFGWENLACLEEATVYVGCQEAWETETEAAETALQHLLLV
ncbi:hypothetical protein EJB05_42426, partial [Eragrostis curvula]